MVKKITIPDLFIKKQEGRKITMLTAYDCPTAKILDEAGVDIILVGDSLGMVVLGYETTLPVTMDEMIHHTKAARRGCQNALLVGDMPFMSYQTSVKDAVHNAGRFLKEAGAQAIKLEGFNSRILEISRAIVDSGIPVMGHIGLTPQTIHQMGGYKVQGKSREAAQQLIENALKLQDAGLFALVLECIPAPLSAELSPQLKIPTLGIGAGMACDGQVMVSYDLLGIIDRKPPKFVKKFADFHAEGIQAVRKFREEVENGVYPSAEHCYQAVL